MHDEWLAALPEPKLQAQSSHLSCQLATVLKKFFFMKKQENSPSQQMSECVRYMRVTYLLRMVEAIRETSFPLLLSIEPRNPGTGMLRHSYPGHCEWDG